MLRSLSFHSISSSSLSYFFSSSSVSPSCPHSPLLLRLISMMHQLPSSEVLGRLDELQRAEAKEEDEEDEEEQENEQGESEEEGDSGGGWQWAEDEASAAEDRGMGTSMEASFTEGLDQEAAEEEEGEGRQDERHGGKKRTSTTEGGRTCAKFS